MSNILDLIARHCPEGVKHKPLGAVAKIKNGGAYRHLGSGEVPVYGSGGVMTHVDTPASEGPTVLIPRKGSLSNLFYVEGPFWNVDTIFRTEIDNAQVEPKFLYHVLRVRRLEELNVAGGVPSLTQRVLSQVRIPVPPLQVQRAIVAFLDRMERLEAELEAELEARTRQYEHYRNALLTFTEEVPLTRLGEIAIVGTGKHDTKDAVQDGEFVFYARGRDPLRLDSFDYDERAIITAGDGVGVGKVFHFADGKYALHQRAYRVVPTSGVDPRYVYHYMVAQFGRYLRRTSVHASVTSLRRPMFLDFPVAIPCLQEQVRIASILDRFDVLVNDLSSGLPAEIAARSKQYAYYRDLLLTFPEKKAA